tara:strand:- start:7298 stop:7687 length:390 start_codon:yes stop_codon:yes gene_type:complete
LNSISTYKIDVQRRLCIQKDLNELNAWISTLEFFNSELDHLSIIEKQLIKNASVSSTILALRRKNVLNMATLCKYEQELKTEYEYGKVEYDLNRLKVHEQRREHYLKLVEECNTFKNQFYMLVRKYQRK